MESNETKNAAVQQSELNKQQNRFALGLTKLNAIMKGSTLKNKVDNNTVSNIVDELLKEEQDRLAVELKEKLKTLLANKIKLEKEIKAKQEEFDKVVAEKYKEYNKELDNLFNMIENVGELSNSYYEALNKLDKEESK